MVLCLDEEEVWKCQKHPSKRRRTGICHVCLRDRLSSLCPVCANVRPCACYASTSSSSSAASSGSFSRFSYAGIGAVGRVSNLIDGEPSFRRSRSLQVPFLRSKPAVDHDFSEHKHSSKTIWSLFKSGNGSKRCDGGGVVLEAEEKEKHDLRRKQGVEEERRRMMMKSRSVAVTSESGQSDVRSGKGRRSWYFLSPIKAFRHSISKGIMVNDRSPMYRG